MKALPNPGDIVKCIKSVQVDKYKFVEGELYTVYDNQEIHVTINAGGDGHFNRCGGFIQDPNMFDGIPYHEHFELKKSAKDIKLFTVTGWKEDKSWAGGSIQTWTEKVDKDRYSHFSLTDQSAHIGLYKLKKVEFTKYVHDITISGSVTKEWNGESNHINPDDAIEFEYGDIVLSPNTKKLSITNSSRGSERKFPIYIDMIDIPKSTKVIAMENVHINYLDCSNADTVYLAYCEVGMLILNPKIKSLVLTGSKIYETQNCEIFQEELN